MSERPSQASADDIKVTPEMVDAGAEVLAALRFDEEYDDQIVTEVFRAMMRARVKSLFQAPEAK
jgi:hypothetical protein